MQKSITDAYGLALKWQMLLGLRDSQGSSLGQPVHTSMTTKYLGM